MARLRYRAKVDAPLPENQRMKLYYGWVVVAAGIVWKWALSQSGVNWADINVLSKAGVNWGDLSTLSTAGINWADLNVLSRTGVNWDVVVPSPSWP